MSREEIALKQGAVVRSGNAAYCIVGTKNMGATCIVYEAEYEDNAKKTHSVYLKECCPDKAVALRQGTQLVWEQPDAKDYALNAFSDAYDKLMVWQENMSTVTAFDKFEANGTQYICMPKKEGENILSVPYKDIKTILKTIESLARALKVYHDNGYLHLDVKPDNFLVFPENPGTVLLFDMDTIVSIQDINDEKKVRIPFSEGWSAPEQTGSILAKPSEATDLYAIGAILFRIIMNRMPRAKDRGLFAHWCFPEKLFGGVNPVVKTKIDSIFRKTLAIHKKDRYQKAEELIDALDDVIQSISFPHLISSFPYPREVFLGRENDLDQIESALRDNTAVVLQGVHGIGKSELARKYAVEHEDEYDAVIYFHYETNLQAFVKELPIHNCTTACFKEKEKSLNRCLRDSKVLFIVDNVDEDIKLDSYRETFFRLNAKFLITTVRTDMPEALARIQIRQIEVLPLSQEKQKALFIKESVRELGDDEQNAIDSLLPYISGCTQLIPFLAKCTDELVVSEIESALQKGLSALKIKKTVQKDEVFHTASAVDILEIIWGIRNLSPAEQEVLQTLYFLRFVVTSKRDIRKYVEPLGEDGEQYIKAVDKLIKGGWIREVTTKNARFPALEMHTNVMQLVENKYSGVITDTCILPAYFENSIPQYLLVMDFDEVPVRAELARILSWLERFYVVANSLNSNTHRNAEFIVNILFKLIHGNTFSPCFCIETHINLSFLSNLQTAIESGTVSDEVKFKMASLMETAYVSCLAGGNALTLNTNLEQQAIESFRNAEACVETLTDLQKEKFIPIILLPVLQTVTYNRRCVSEALRTTFDMLIKKHITASSLPEEWISLYNDFNKISLPATYTYKSYFDFLNDDAVLQYVQLFKNGCSMDELHTKIVTDERLSVEHQMAIYHTIVNDLLPEFPSELYEAEFKDKNRDLLNEYCAKACENVNWQEIYCVLQYRQLFCDQLQASGNNHGYFSEVTEIFMIATLAVLQGDSFELRSKIDCAFQNYKKRIDNIMQEEDWQYALTYDQEISIAVNLEAVGKADFALKYLLRCAEYLKQKCKDLSCFSEDTMYDLYFWIQHCAFLAYKEDVFREYHEKLAAITEESEYK